MASMDKFEFCEAESPFCKTFEDMFKSGELTDVTITIGNRAFRAHRMILATVFPYFRTRFKRHTLNNREEKVKLPNIDSDAFECLLNFAYTGKISVVKENVKKLIIAANYLQHTKVRKACFEFLSGQFSPENVLDLRTLGNSMNCYEFVKEADIFIGENFELLRLTREFLNAPFDLLMEIVSRTDIEVKKTENVYEAISSWLKADPGRTCKFIELVTCVQKQLSLPTNKCTKEDEICGTPPKISRTLLDSPWSHEDVFGVYTVSASSSYNRVIHNYNSYTNTWTKIAEHNEPRSFTTVAAVCGLIFAFTGDHLEFFDGRSWNCCGELPWDVKTRSGTPVTWGNKIYWFPNIMHKACSVWCFNVKYQNWQEEAPGLKLISPGLVSLGNYIYVLGGFAPSGVTSAAMFYDPKYEEFKQISPMTERRSNPRCAVLNDKVYVCGGYGGHSSFLNTAEVYDPSDGQWEFIAPMNKKWSNFSIVPCEGKLFLIGRHDDDVNDTVEIYDPKKTVWESGPRFPDRWNSLKAVVISA